MNDTTQEAVRAQRAQIKLMRELGPHGRLQLALKLSHEDHLRAWQEIVEANPELSLAEQKLLFIEVRYGRDLSERVREYVRKRSPKAWSLQ